MAVEGKIKEFEAFSLCVFKLDNPLNQVKQVACSSILEGDNQLGTRWENTNGLSQKSLEQMDHRIALHR